MSNEKGNNNLALSLWYLIKVTASKYINLKDNMMRKSFLHSINLYIVIYILINNCKVIKCSGKTVK